MVDTTSSISVGIGIRTEYRVGVGTYNTSMAYEVAASESAALLHVLYARADTYGVVGTCS